MNSALALQLMRFGFLVLLWLFVLACMRVMRSDLRTSGAAAHRAPAAGPPSRRATPAPPQAAGRADAPGRHRGRTAPAPASASPARRSCIGRANDSTLVLTDDYASTRHARISLQDGVWVVEDLGSTNGTYLGSAQARRPDAAGAGVPLRIGKTVLELR